MTFDNLITQSEFESLSLETKDALEELNIGVVKETYGDKLHIGGEAGFDGKGIYMMINGKKLYELNDTNKDGFLYFRPRKRNFIYIGNCEDGKFNGEGRIFFKDGSTYVGIWEDGKIVSGRKYENGNKVDCDDEKIKKEVNGRIEAEMKRHKDEVARRNVTQGNDGQPTQPKVDRVVQGSQVTVVSSKGGEDADPKTDGAQKIEDSGELETGDVEEIDKSTFGVLCKGTSLTLTQIKQVVGYANKNSEGWLFLNGLTSINEGMARELAKFQGYNLMLNSLTKIDVDVAAQLSKVQGNLNLGGLTKIDVDVAEQLSKVQGNLGLDGLTEIDADVAEQLSKVQGGLWLVGLTKINVDVASQLSNFQGYYLRLNSLTKIDVDVASQLSNFQCDNLRLSGLTEIDADVAEQLSKFQGGLELNGLTEINIEIASQLSKHHGSLWLGLTKIDVDVAEKLSKVQGSLGIDGLTEINIEIASQLSKPQGGRLSLFGLKEIDVGIAEELSKHQGGLSLYGLRKISNDVATVLARVDNLHINGYILSDEQKQILQKHISK